MNKLKIIEQQILKKKLNNMKNKWKMKNYNI